MSDEEYGKFKESQEYQKLKEAEEKSGTPQYTDLMDKARLDKDSEEYKKLSDEDKAKVDKVHESLTKLDKNEARKKLWKHVASSSPPVRLNATAKAVTQKSRPNSKTTPTATNTTTQ